MTEHHGTEVLLGESPRPGDVPEPIHRRPWWLRIGFESGQSTAGCSELGCDAGAEIPTDLFCRNHQRFLPFATNRPSKLRWLGINAVRAVAIGIFPLAAWLNLSSPLFWLGAVVFGALLVLPLRSYRRTRAAGASAWTVACAISFVVINTGSQVSQAIGSIMVVVVLLGLAAYLGGLAWIYGRAEPLDSDGVPQHQDTQERDVMDRAARTSGRAAGVVAASALMTPLAMVLFALNEIVPDSALPWPSASVRTLLLGVALTAAVGALLAALVVGFLHGVGRVNRHVQPRPKIPQQPRRFDFGRARPVQGIASWGRILSSFELTARRTSQAIANLLLSTAYALLIAILYSAQWFHRVGTLTGRGLWQTVLGMARNLRDAASIARIASLNAVRVILIPLGCIAVAAWLLATASDGIRDYLVIGSFGALGVGVASIALIVILTNGAWMALSGLKSTEARKSARWNTELATPQLLAIVAVGGWIVGIPGSLGYGPIHVGYVTVGLTILIAIFAFWGNRSARQLVQQAGSLRTN